MSPYFGVNEAFPDLGSAGRESSTHNEPRLVTTLLLGHGDGCVHSFGEWNHLYITILERYPASDRERERGKEVRFLLMRGVQYQI